MVYLCVVMMIGIVVFAASFPSEGRRASKSSQFCFPAMYNPCHEIMTMQLFADSCSVLLGRRSRSGSALYSKDFFNSLVSQQSNGGQTSEALCSLVGTNVNHANDTSGLDGADHFEPEFQRVTVLHPVEGKTVVEVSTNSS